MSNTRHQNRRPRGSTRFRTVALFLLCAFAGFPSGSEPHTNFGTVTAGPMNDGTLESGDVDEASDGTSQEADAGSITVSASQLKNAGIQIGRPTKKLFSENIRLTGKISLNEDRLSHIYPMVEGAVDEVAVGLGDAVEKDQLLVVVHSREVGRAKLELFRSRLELEMAKTKDDLQRELVKNTRELLSSLREEMEITEIEKRFSGSNMGDYRERLLSAYAEYIKSEADVARLEEVAGTGAISGKQLLAARSQRNADLATFQARIEQIAYEVQTSLLASSQAVKSATTSVAVATTNLRILGCDESEINEIDPLEQGESISHYPIRAPFHGTIISKDVTLGEQVRPDSQIMTIADLSTVWIKADIYERDVHLLPSLSGSELEFTSEAWPGRSFTAKVFYTGEIMDEKTRTVGLRAIANNPDHLLKPGMFVNIRLSAAAPLPSLQVPAAAVQQHQGKHFVFVQVGKLDFQRRDVELGRADREWAEILDGLDVDDSVVVSGGFILKSKMLESLMGEE